MIRTASKDLMTKKAAAPAAKLSDEERAELTTHEATIERGKKAFLEMGRAFRAICEKRLYRETHKNLEDYFWERFELARSTVCQLMDAARCFDGNDKHIQEHRFSFTAESQLRPLARCKPSEVAAVLKIAAKKVEPDAETGLRRPTWKQMAEAVREHRGEPLSRNDATVARKEAAGRKAEDPHRVPELPTWPDKALLRLASAVATELNNRGLINLNRALAAV